MELYKFFAVLIILLTISYGAIRSDKYLFGPSLEVFSPINNSIVSQSFKINGISDATHISVNDKKIHTNRDGFFSESFLFPTGYTIVNISAKDKYGKEKVVNLTLYIEKNDKESNHKENTS